MSVAECCSASHAHVPVKSRVVVSFGGWGLLEFEAFEGLMVYFRV